MTKTESRGDRERVILARTLFWAAGKLSRIRTKQKMFRVVWDEPTEDRPHGFHTVPSEAVRVPCRTSVRLLSMAMQQAWDHWDHFALDHSDHLTDCVRCPDRRCHGWVHARREFDLCGND